MAFLKNLFNPAKEEKITTYSEFWSWFQQHEKEFHNVVKAHNNVEADFFNKLSPKLEQLNKGFYFLAGMCNKQTAELIITADANIKNIVFVEEIISAAPAISGWKFTAHKPATPGCKINMAEHLFSGDTINFYSSDSVGYPDQIDITLVHRDYNANNRRTIINGSYIFIDNLLGELNSVSIIDNLSIVGPAEAIKELVPIEKLDDFLIWRQKEFVEKYEGKRYNTKNDEYSSFTMKHESGMVYVAIINTQLLKWDAKASHPWMTKIVIKYDGSKNNGMPDNETYQLLNEIEDEILKDLKDHEGYLNIGRQTGDNLREIYIAAKDFRKPSKILTEITKKYSNKFEIGFDIFKDKYWRSLNRFMDALQ